MSQELFSVFDYMREAVVAVAEGKIKYFNSAAKKLIPELEPGLEAGEIFKDVRDIDGVQYLPELGSVTVSHTGDTALYTATGEDGPLQGLWAAELTRDIRGILSELRFSSDLIFRNMGPMDEKQQHYMGVFQRAYFRMIYLVENIEALYDESEINSPPRRDIVSLDRICYNVADIVSCMMDGRIKIIYKEYKDGLCCSLDKGKIERMLLAIVSNSLKNIEMETGTITISLTRERDMAVIAIKDNGPGIPEEKKRDILDMRIKERDLKDSKAGLGLGLPVAARLAAQHGGRLSVESGAGGTVVKAYIPVVTGVLQFRSPDDEDNISLRRVLTSLSPAMPPECYKRKYTS